MEFREKNVLVVGAGKSGVSASILLRGLGANVFLQDSNPDPKIPEISGIQTLFGIKIAPLLPDFDILVLSPGVSIYEDFVQEAIKLGKAVIGEVELAYQLCRHIPILAITGTNGKTTATSMLGAIMQKYAPKSRIVGNIGIAFSSVVSEILQETQDNLFIVAEISSFQLESIRDFRPKISAVLNITEDHLDRHLTMENYINSKERIFENQTKNDIVVLNYDNEHTKKMAQKTNATPLFFSIKDYNTNAYVQENSIFINIDGNPIRIMNLKEFKLLGKHNIENALAASLMAYSADVSAECIAEALREFNAVEHRIELVCEINGIKFINDSKATNVTSAITAIKAVSEAITGKIVLIAGGYNKGLDYSPLFEAFDGKIAHLICLGEIKNQLLETAKKHNFKNAMLANNLQHAVDLAFELAKSGDAVLLSPATSSYDMFANFEKRGEAFKKIVAGYA